MFIDNYFIYSEIVDKWKLSYSFFVALTVSNYNRFTSSHFTTSGNKSSHKEKTIPLLHALPAHCYTKKTPFCELQKQITVEFQVQSLHSSSHDLYCLNTFFTFSLLNIWHLKLTPYYDLLLCFI